MPYFPSRDHWDAKSPAELGLAPDTLAAAIDYHKSHETTSFRDFLTASGRYIGVADEPPAPDDVLGPVEPAQWVNGLVLRQRTSSPSGATPPGGHDLQRGQELLATLAGLALDRGLIRDLDEPVRSTARRRLRLPHNSYDHLAPPPPADQRVGGHPLGQARRDGPQPRPGRATSV